MELIFATGNAGKLREAREICAALGRKYGVELTILPMPDNADIPETGRTYEENAMQKAQYVWKRYGRNCIADDSGMEVDALDGGPGIYTARYCDHNFSDGIEKMLFELQQKGATTPERRRASFECCLALIVDGKKYWFRGHCPGTVHSQRCGDFGFGFDPVFIADATPGKCMAELSEERKNEVSHRALAFEELFKALKDKKL